ncbi:carbohydrate ABC transporter permease [Actinoplanes derwentensis]|uniref:Carbohydrate ABC transporter membrane protein 2, CUT1 family n=1 Tax=Actinoplanes derwentensis TaxID=113562 RepID=A0A1H1STW7_9ACTN|nr:carbohydrate ABC transporter permease [Actinoplanes derwentensis]GID83212.1 sugar ABC transporter permease [Actinoplanes derwentensis]SDS51298.1 carbohydrate ABC transporter membrane protein 2, CUT1 family [Actinoplanes derwentensis]
MTSRTRRTVSAPATVTLWVLAGLFLFPLAWFLLSSFKPGGELFSYPLSILPRDWTTAGYVKAWDRVDFSLYFGNTLLVATITTILTVVVSAATGYALAKYKAWWLTALFMCILATTMLPTEVILSPTFVVIRDLGLYDTLAGIIVPSILTASGIFMFRQFYKTVPDELLEAARIDGARELTVFFRIMLPLARPIVITLGIFSFQWRWNDYIWPLIVLGDPDKFTLQVALRSLIGAENIDWTVLLPASIISIIPLVAMFLVAQRYVMSSDLNSGLKD